MSEMFTYNASSLAVGGKLKINGRQVIVPSLASVALSPTGGEGWSEIVNYHNEDGISFSHAQSYVVGFANAAENEFTTISEVRVSGLNVFDRLKIDWLEARVESRHVLRQESTFNVQVSYRNVVVDDIEVAPVIDVDLASSAYDTFGALETKLLGDTYGYAERFEMEKGDLVNTLADPMKPQLRASLTSHINMVRRDPMTKAATTSVAPYKGHSLLVPKFGRAHFAEYLVKPGRRRVTLLRLELDDMEQFVKEEEENKNLVFHADKLQSPMPGRNAIVFANAAGADSFSGSLALASVDGNGSPPWKP